MLTMARNADRKADAGKFAPKTTVLHLAGDPEGQTDADRQVLMPFLPTSTLLHQFSTRLGEL